MQTNGDWSDNIYKPKAANQLWSWVAGRASVGEEYAGQPFTSTDMAKEGLLYKQGSWFKVKLSLP